MDAGSAAGMVALWVALGLLSAVPIMLLLRDWAEGGVEGGYAVASIVAILALLGGTWRMQGTLWMVLFIALLLTACIVLPLVKRRAEKQLVQTMDDEDMTRCLAAIERDNRNAGAHAGLADCYFKRGELQQSLASYDTALSLSPDAERNPQAAKWQRKRRDVAEAAEVEAVRVRAKEGRRVV